jgi:hypothetical protein
MALPDYPRFTIDWDTGLEPGMLRAIGNLAVASAHAEELLHQIYWNHAGLDGQSGPIVTDNLSPKRLCADIIKLVELNPTKANVFADLKVLLSELQELSTKRNQCVHWIWEAAERESDVTVTWPDKPTQYRVKRPLYRQKGILSEHYTVENLRTYCNEFSWIAFRLRSHTFPDETLREKRRGLAGSPPINGMSPADLFWPAPWLDKPQSQGSPDLNKS